MSDSVEDAENAIRYSLEKPTLSDPASVADRFGEWLDRNGGGRVVDVRTPSTSGASSELYIVDVADGDLTGEGTNAIVLRLISDRVAYPYVDPEMQYLCQKLLGERSRAPVPKALAFEADPNFLGAAFVLIEYVTGNGAPDWPSYVREGWIADLSADERLTMWRNSIALIADFHATDLSGVDIARLSLRSDGATPIAQLADYWRVYLDVVRQEGDYPALERAIAWLHSERPDIDEPPVFVWGDASLRNMLFDRLEPVAALDLEFAHIGVRAFDVAFFVMMDRVMAEAYAGVPRLTGFLDETKTFDFYEELTGRAIRHRDYFCRMAVTYMALANTRVFQRLAREGKMPVEDVALNAPLRFLANMFED